MVRAAMTRRRAADAGPGEIVVPPSPSVERRVSRPGDLDVACDLLADAGSVVVLAHVQPDADALGSALALGLALSRHGVDVSVAFSEPAGVPESLRGLPGQHLLCSPAAVNESPDLLVTVDVNSHHRLGALGRLTGTARHTLVIDHHASNTRFGSHHLVDAHAESTTVLIAAILDRSGLPIDVDIAANLYAGLATDTVGFRHASASAHRLAARLLDTGVQPDALMRPITDTHPFGWLTMVAAVLSRAQLMPATEQRVGLVWTSIAIADAVGLRSEELDSVIDILRTTAEAPVAAVFKQTGVDRWQVSLRSLPVVDVAALASRLGGGGHVRAAGFTFEGSAADGARLLAATLGC